MKDKNIYKLVSIILFIFGLAFSYFVAEIDDAPGFIFVGTAVTTLFCLILFGIGELIESIKNNNVLLENIHKELKNK
ncbi:MAG: hypothetical protein PHI05_01080 [Bacilli bacterium]|nr:hypothetical protein [Bacilli bacterium]MDD4547322.1 hypothetical protein [Bacilli bacterium]